MWASHSHNGSGGPPSYDIWTSEGYQGDLNSAETNNLNITYEVYEVTKHTIYTYSKNTYNVKRAWLYRDQKEKPALFDPKRESE